MFNNVSSAAGILTVLRGVVATMTSSTSRRAVFMVLLAVAAVSCRHHDTVDRRPASLNLLEPVTRALAAATRRQLAEHLAANNKRGWRKDRVRVWGKRTTIDDDDDDDADDNANKRSWSKNTVRVWGKRQGAATADRRAWADNTIPVWGKRRSAGQTPEQILDVAAARYNAAPKRSIGSSDARTSRLYDGGHRKPTRLSAVSGVDVGNSADSSVMATRSKRSPAGYHHGGRWVVRRAVSRRPRWVAFRGPKRSWRTNVIRVWGKRAS